MKQQTVFRSPAVTGTSAPKAGGETEGCRVVSPSPARRAGRQKGRQRQAEGGGQKGRQRQADGQAGAARGAGRGRRCPAEGGGRARSPGSH